MYHSRADEEVPFAVASQVSRMLPNCELIAAQDTPHHSAKALLDFLIPLYISEGKNQLVIGIACTGGKHRSVTIAEKLYQSIKDMENIGVRLDHRDINK